MPEGLTPEYTYIELEKLAGKLRSEHPEARRGQALMWALARLDNDLFRDISGTEADCFYVDDLIVNFVPKVQETILRRIRGDM